MDMRERLIEVVERGRDKDHAPETVVDALLAVLREPDDDMLDAAHDPTRAAVAFNGDGFVSSYFSLPIWQAMIDAARSPVGKE